jgi:hypothetical protein
MDANDYLTLPSAYADALGGLRWAADCTAIEFDGGRTLAVVEHLALLLEGVFTAHPAVPHFAHVLHLLKLTSRGGARAPQGPARRLHEAFQAAAGPGTSRNIGVLFARLCRGLPHVAAPPHPRAVQLDLKRRVLFPEPPDPRRAEKPAFGPDDFERRIADVLSDYDVPELVQWIRHGCGSLDHAVRRLAEAVKPPPRRVEPLTAVLRRRPRLAGAVALAPALDAALSLPPRRRRPDAVPQGGYAGVVTRGDPERLLPSQFALEPLDFVRRFAENELLYFRREEPHRGEQPARLVVLDQGVRTWGDVRLGLAAAVVALAGKDRRRFGPLRLAVTSADKPPLDPAEVESAALADLLEASDLTPHPATRLAAALTDATDRRPRDVILLTHPRNLTEPAVRQAAAGRRPTDRLFALAVGDDGRAELGEWRGGGIVRLRSFRVNLTEPEPKLPALPAPAPAEGDWRPWNGAVEPIAYPFRPGLLGEPRALAFDASGEHVAVLGPAGLLQVAKLDGSAPEVLPRAVLDGVPLTLVEAVLGVDGGFVVCGKIGGRPGTFHFDSTVDGGGYLITTSVAAHYDLTRRSVIVHRLGMAGSRTGRWFSFPDLNAVAVVNAAGHIAIDLGTGDRFPTDRPKSDAVVRAQEAQGRAKELLRPPPGIRLLDTTEPPGWGGPYLRVTDGVVSVVNVEPPWPPFTPTSEGRPLLDGRTVTDDGQLAGQTLAFCATGSKGGARLFAFQGPHGRMLVDVERGARDFLFQLSADGHRLARQVTKGVVVVTELADGRELCGLNWAGTHTVVAVEPYHDSVVLWVGNYNHTFEWEDGKLEHRCSSWYRKRSGTTLTKSSEPARGAAAYDPDRFRKAVPAGGEFVQDSWGQVIMLNKDGQPAAYLLIRRNRAAIVLPDGTRWGAPALLGGPETPGAAEKIGRAFKEVWSR